MRYIKNMILKGINKSPGENISITIPTITVPKHSPSQAISTNMPPIIIAAPNIILKIHIKVSYIFLYIFKLYFRKT